MLVCLQSAINQCITHSPHDTQSHTNIYVMVHNNKPIDLKRSASVEITSSSMPTTMSPSSIPPEVERDVPLIPYIDAIHAMRLLKYRASSALCVDGLSDACIALRKGHESRRNNFNNRRTGFLRRGACWAVQHQNAVLDS